MDRRRVDPGVVNCPRVVGSWLRAASEVKGALGRFGLPGQRSPAESGGVWGGGSGPKSPWIGGWESLGVGGSRGSFGRNPASRKQKD